jgi:hypothetical protein
MIYEHDRCQQHDDQRIVSTGEVGDMEWRMMVLSQHMIFGKVGSVGLAVTLGW